MIFRQFCTADGQLSYLFADPVTRHAAVVDPHLSLEQDYLGVIRHLDLQLKFAMETHAHESHFSAAPRLCETTGADWIMHRLLAGAGGTLGVDDGECVYMGEDCIAALETPGHSAFSMCFRWSGRVFTGHTLLAGKTGDCHRYDADCQRLYDSITRRLYTLPEETLVYPGVEAAGRRESTIGRELESNEELNRKTTFEAFLNAKEGAGGGRPGTKLPRAAFGQPGAKFYKFNKAGDA